MNRFVVVLHLGLAAALCGSGLGFAADGKALYAKCSGCHGADGTKKALGVGKPLKGMSAADLAKALNGYKAKTYGAAKKATMERLAQNLSAEDVDALADYISKLP